MQVLLRCCLTGAAAEYGRSVCLYRPMISLFVRLALRGEGLVVRGWASTVSGNIST